MTGGALDVGDGGERHGQLALQERMIGRADEDLSPFALGPPVRPQGVRRLVLGAQRLAGPHEVPGAIDRALWSGHFHRQGFERDLGGLFRTGVPREADRRELLLQGVEVPDDHLLLDARDREPGTVGADRQFVDRAVVRRKGEPRLERGGVMHQHAMIVASSDQMLAVGSDRDAPDRPLMHRL